MKCLAVNTATKILSIAIVEDGRVIHSFATPEMRDQGNVLLDHIRSGLARNDLDFPDLDLLAVVTGPGSFTGIRVGLAAMRGIALAANKPLVGLSSFDMFAVRTADAINIIAVESWREELYFAVLDEDGHPLIECMNETPGVFSRQFQPIGQNIVISGDAREAVAGLFRGAQLAKKDATAADAAQLAIQKFQKGGSFVRPVPYYLREADVTVSARVSKALGEK
ncbi:MAG: tRNA (adenosine(37)-N6)-threonylcarbamoyltransferase complex dimerization subunit type 1 TsaB [Proteobacteria bacterium]|nr:tRNA (adenosine(37)-N6)-threonylcarbamoyltransferase complex dimerization subunit type 1 TsaB [Pseudomonadota bacterium]